MVTLHLQGSAKIRKDLGAPEIGYVLMVLTCPGSHVDNANSQHISVPSIVASYVCINIYIYVSVGLFVCCSHK